MWTLQTCSQFRRSPNQNKADKAEMNKHFTLKSINSKLLATLSLCLAIATPLPTLAAYVPPTDQVPSRSRGGTAGRRGPCETTAVNRSNYLGVAALAPVSYLGKTVSTRPTLAWFTDYCSAVPVQLSLYEYHSTENRIIAEPIFTQKIVANPGISVFTMPQEVASLSVGKTYVWQVVVDTNSPAKTPWFRIPIQVAELPSELPSELERVTSPVEKANLYAKAGLWYDALAITLQSGVQNRVSMLALLGDLASLEQKREPIEQPLARRFSHTLQQIVQIEKKRDRISSSF